MEIVVTAPTPTVQSPVNMMQQPPDQPPRPSQPPAVAPSQPPPPRPAPVQPQRPVEPPQPPRPTEPPQPPRPAVPPQLPPAPVQPQRPAEPPRPADPPKSVPVIPKQPQRPVELPKAEVPPTVQVAEATDEDTSEEAEALETAAVEVVVDPDDPFGSTAADQDNEGANWAFGDQSSSPPDPAPNPQAERATTQSEASISTKQPSGASTATASTEPQKPTEIPPPNIIDIPQLVFEECKEENYHSSFSESEPEQNEPTPPESEVVKARSPSPPSDRWPLSLLLLTATGLSAIGGRGNRMQWTRPHKRRVSRTSSAWSPSSVEGSTMPKANLFRVAAMLGPTSTSNSRRDTDPCSGDTLRLARATL